MRVLQDNSKHYIKICQNCFSKLELTRADYKKQNDSNNDYFGECHIHNLVYFECPCCGQKNIVYEYLDGKVYIDTREDSVK